MKIVYCISRHPQLVKFTKQFFNILKNLLLNNENEVVLWVLKVLEDSGTQGNVLYDEVNSLKLSWTSSFSSGGKEVKQLRDKLISKWENIPRPPK